MIVHIGFGKCGTTSLQRHVFARLTEMGLISDYNPDEIKGSLGLFRRGDTSQIPALRAFFERQRGQKILVSLESLIGWNPAIWQERLAMNREIFPEGSTILITIREPESFMRSFFQQNWHQGNVVPPEQFFLSRADYDRARLTSRFQIAEIFSVDEMNYREIVRDYARAFSKVVVVPINRVNELEFLGDLSLSADPEQIAILQNYMSSGSRENRAYSRTAMILTRGREQLLNGLGLKSLSEIDRDYRQRFLKRPRQAAPTELGRRAAHRGLALLRLPRWRWLMHRVVDRLWPYASYKLPPECPRGVHHEDNKVFVEEVLQQPRGIAIFER